MKKRIFSLLLVIAMLVTVLPVNAFAADDCPSGTGHILNAYSNYDGTHRVFCTYGFYYGCEYEEIVPCSWGACKYSDSTQHYQQCTLCKDYKYSNHNCTNWTVSSSYGSYRHSGTCKDCGYNVSASCSYEYGKYTTENGQHWQVCTVCGNPGKKTPCSSVFGAKDNKNGTHSVTCDTCNVASTAPCTFGSYTYDYSTGSQGHYQKCTACDNKTALTPHTNKTYTPSYDGVHTVKCKDCGYSLGNGECQYGGYSQTATQHSRTCTLCGDTVTDYHSYNSQNKCVCGAEKHIHNWVVSASGNTITVKCTGATGTCEYDKDGGKLIVSASDAAYDGSAKGVTIDNTIETGSYNDDGFNVTYYEKQENGKYGSWGSSTAPVDVGEYKAEVYSYLDDDQKASVTFKITTGTLTATAEGYTGAYDGKAHGITVNAPSSAEVTYSLTQDGSYSWVAPTFTEVGEYTVYYKVTEDSGNYAPDVVSGSQTVKITVADLKDLLDVTAADKESVYTGYSYDEDYKDNSISVNVSYKNGAYALPGYKNYTIEYKYGTEDWSTQNPKFTDAGTYPVQYRIYVRGDYDIDAGGYSINKNFTPITGEQKVTINPADLPIDEVVGYRGYYDGFNHYALGFKQGNVTWIPSTPWASYMDENFEFTFTWIPEGESTPVTTTATTADGYEGRSNWPHYKLQNVAKLSDAGGASVTVTIVDKEGNYNTETFTYTVKIGPALAVAEDYVGEYDADTHYISNYLTTYAPNLQYKETGTDTWLPASQEPGRKDVGVTSVDWKAKADSDGDGKIGGYDANGNADPNGIYNTFGSKEIITGTNTITVTPAELVVTANDNTITYGDEPAANGVTITGFKGTETADDVLDQTGLSFTYSYNQYDNVGEYTITPAGIKLVEGNENYTISFVDGKLTVEQKELGIEWDNLVLPYTGEAQIPTATATGTVNGDEITLTVEGAATEVGEYTATVTGMTGEKVGNYKLPADGLTVTFKIGKKTVDAPDVTAKDETIRGKNDGGIEGLTTEMEYSTDGGNTWTKVTDPDAALPVGTYQVRYSETDISLPSEATEVTIKEGKYLTVTLPEGDGYTTSTEENADEQTYNDTLTFEVEIKDGYSKGDDFKVTANGEELTPNADGSYTITGIVEDVVVKVEGVVDNTAPTGTITVATNQWKEFINNITFDIFFKNTQTVTITAEDAGSGIKSIEYIYGDAVLTEEQVKAIASGEWAPYVAPFEIDPDAKVVVYAKITDKAGNVKYICSNGMVFDGTGPVFNGIQDGGEYNSDTKFTVTDDNLDKVTVDGKEVKPDKDGNYILPMDGKEHVIIATDKSGNETKITVNMKEKAAAPVVKPNAPVVKPNAPETGDEGFFLPLMLFMLSGIAGVILVASKKKFRF